MCSSEAESTTSVEALPPAEDGGADADDGRALGDGFAEIAAHAHGEFGQPDAEFLFKRVPLCAERGEHAVKRRFVGSERGHGHQAADLDAGERERGLQRGAEVVGGPEPGLVFLAGVDLEQDADRLVE